MLIRFLTRHRSLAPALLVASAAFLPVSGHAQTVDASDPGALVNLIRGFGSATLDKDNEGDPRITGRIDGHRFTVFFYGCDDAGANCKSVNFFAAVQKKGISLEQVNAWNAKRRFHRLYLDSDGDPVMEMDINLAGGVTIDNFEDTVDWWKVLLEDYYTELIEKQQDPQP